MHKAPRPFWGLHLTNTISLCSSPVIKKLTRQSTSNPTQGVFNFQLSQTCAGNSWQGVCSDGYAISLTFTTAKTPALIQTCTSSSVLILFMFTNTWLLWKWGANDPDLQLDPHWCVGKHIVHSPLLRTVFYTCPPETKNHTHLLCQRVLTHYPASSFWPENYSKAYVLLHKSCNLWPCMWTSAGTYSSLKPVDDIWLLFTPFHSICNFTA